MSHRSDLLQKCSHFNLFQEQFSTCALRIGRFILFSLILGLAGCSVQTQFTGDATWQYQHSSERTAGQ